MALFPFAGVAKTASAAPHECKVALREGTLHVADLSAVLCREMHLPKKVVKHAARDVPGEIDLRGLKRSDFVAALDGALGDGCRVSVSDDALVLSVDPDKLPRDCDEARRAARVFTALAAPEATAAQYRRYGLFLPEHFDPAKPLVVLVHGLGSDRSMWQPMADLLTGAGFQVAYFDYPADEPIEESAALLARRFADLRREEPGLAVDVVAHSMGGLVARAFVEGPGYSGGVDRLIMIGTPNHGSAWARCGLLVKFRQDYLQWRTDPAWRATWMITEGVGEADRDLAPGSKFLERVNGLPRRPGVRYTVVAGTQSPTSRWAAECAGASAGHLAGGVWGLRQCRAALLRAAAALRGRTGDDDGVVPVSSATLLGVEDLVLVPADHISLCWPEDGQPPGAWDAVRDRLTR